MSMFSEQEWQEAEAPHLAPGPAAFSVNGNGADVEHGTEPEPYPDAASDVLSRIDRMEWAVILVATGLAALALAMLIASRR
jgi:hypothetical protein